MALPRIIKDYLNKFFLSNPPLAERPPRVKSRVVPLDLDSALKRFLNGDPGGMEAIFNKLELDEHADGCISSRLSATSGLNLQFTAPDDSPDVTRQWEFLTEQFKSMEVPELLETILEAKFRLFKVIAPLWEVNGNLNLAGWKAYENDLFLFDADDIYINTAGKKVEFANSSTDWYLAVKVRSQKSIMLRCVASYIIKTFGYESWAHFIEVFSDPFRVGKYPDGAGQEIRDQVYQAVYTLGQDGAAAIPQSAAIEFVENTRTGGDTFQTLVDKCEQGISKAILGHSAAADATPGKLGEEGNALAARADLIKADQRFALKWLYKGFVKPLLQFNFANPAEIVPILTESEVITRDEKLNALQAFYNMGLEIDPLEAEEWGITVQEDAPLLKKTTDFIF